MNFAEKRPCFGCGIRAEAHPMRAVLNEVDAEVGSDPLRFVTVDVCAPCHEDPAHRQRPIKGTFFTPKEAENARQLAGVRDEKGEPVRTP
jgi:hypothetical protein